MSKREKHMYEVVKNTTNCLEQIDEALAKATGEERA